MDSKTYTQIVSETAEKMSSQDILDRYGITEYNVSDIVGEFETAMSYKVEQEKVFKILDAADHSDIWKVYNRKIPHYVQTPVNNPITIIKEATKASIMPTAYAGDFRPLTVDARELANTANRYFQMKWNASNMDEVNGEAADYAYLHGTSGVLFGWNNNIIDSSDITAQFNAGIHSQIQAKAYHPTNVFPDPGASVVDEMRYIFFAERKSKDFLRGIPRFQQALANIENVNDSYGNLDPNYILDKAKQSGKDIVTFLTCYKRVLRLKPNPVTGIVTLTPSVDIIYMAGRDILDISKDIQPACIPFVPLYDEKVPNNFWGISKCYKVLSLVLTLNQLDSTEATAYFKNQNPTEFINALSGLNVAEYQRKKENPDAAFTVNCDPDRVQSYAERPQLPKDLDTFRQYLITMIQEVSGVDSAYLGRSYGSIQTTGGVTQAIDRATMRDNTRIKSIDKFIRKELELMVQFYIAHGQREKFYAQDVDLRRQVDGQELEFDPMLLVGRHDIEIVVSNSAPRSNASYEEAAQKLFELQMKYNPAEKGYPDLITPEELIGWLNIPKAQQNVLIDRMKAQMENMKVEEYTAVLTAVGALTQGGMPPEMAVQEVAKMIEMSAMGQLPATNVNPGQPMQR
jgi:hypothetical protein